MTTRCFQDLNEFGAMFTIKLGDFAIAFGCELSLFIDQRDIDSYILLTHILMEFDEIMIWFFMKINNSQFHRTCTNE